MLVKNLKVIEIDKSVINFEKAYLGLFRFY